VRLDAIHEASIVPGSDGMVLLRFGLPGGRAVESLFEASRREALEALLAVR
jgi:hypothetical protein